MGSEQDIWQVLLCDTCYSLIWWDIDFVSIEWIVNDFDCGDAFFKATEKVCQFYQILTENSKH